MTRFHAPQLDILQDPPLWYELLEEGRKDGSIKTEYAKELSELLPLINFWFVPSIYPATNEEPHRKFAFMVEMLEKMGLPLFRDEMKAVAENSLGNCRQTRRRTQAG